MTDIFNTLIENAFGPLVIGLVLWILGEKVIDKRIKNEAIRDLMTNRGDYASSAFRKSLNRISITFHKDEKIRKEIRDLYEVINSKASDEGNINRKIVGLIYNLCQKNGFTGITEYDIDQAFPETQQSPMAQELTSDLEVSSSVSASPTEKKK